MHRLPIHVVLALALTGTAAMAQSADVLRRDCTQMDNLELKIRACGQWLEAVPNLAAKDRAFGLVQRGIALRRTGDFESAIAHYNEALKIDPNSAQALNNRGFALEKKGEFERALADYTQALRLEPTLRIALVNRGNLYKLRREWAKAIADYTAVVQLGDAKPQIFMDRGLAYLNLGDNDRAIVDFNAALRGAPNNAALLVNRGVAYARKRDLARAIADYQEALRVAPDYTLARQNLAAATEELSRSTPVKPSLKPLPRPGETIVAANPATPLAAIPSAAIAETRVALVIGNAAYTGVSPLRNSVNDAQAIAAKLREVGFSKVTMVTDVSREAMMKALAAFARDAETADWAVVYYAGHGMQIGGTNWLIPTDASPKSDRDMQFQAVSVDQVIAAVDGAKRLRLVVLDACRDNPFAAQMRLTNSATRSIGRGLGRMEPSSTLVAFAAKDGQVAADGDGKHSPFAEALIRNINTPGLEVNRLFRRVAAEVLRATNNQQEPLTYGRLPDEDLFFVAPRPGPGAVTTAPTAPVAPIKRS